MMHLRQSTSSVRMLTLLSLLMILALPFAAGAKERSPQPVNMADMVREFVADERDVRQAFEMPASTTDFDRSERLQQQWIRRLGALDFDALDHSGQVDYLLLENEIERTIHEVGQQRKRLAEIDRLVGFRRVILDLEQARRQMKPMDFSKVAENLAQLADTVKQLHQRVEQDIKAKPGAVKPAEALRAAQTVQALLRTLDDWAKQSVGFSPEFDWWVKKPYDDARKLLEEYAKYLRDELAQQKGKPEDPLVGTPIGAEAVAAEIRFQMLPYSADELIAIGQEDLAWGEQQMKEQSRRMGSGDDWHAALARVKADHVPPGGQAALIARIGREATAFVDQHKLVTVPALCRENWRTTMMSPEQLKVVPYAAYSGSSMLVAYAQQSMPEEDKLMVMRGNNRHFMRLVVPHELIPGHHLQDFYASRYQTHRERFGTPFYIEGWAFSWELRLWDLDWAQTPEDRIGMLFWRMTRAARIVVSLSYHLGRMQPPEMVDFLIRRVGHEKFGATSEVRRFISASPLYQAGYMIGGMQLEALRREMTAPGKWTEQQFHDAVLRTGPMPIAALRAELSGQPLRRDTRLDWRFVEPKKKP